MNRSFREILKKAIPGNVYFSLSKAYFKILPLLYKGDNVYCPWCEKKYSKFPILEKFYYTQYYCPSCGTLGRHRALWFYLNEMGILKSEKKIKILHVSPEMIIQDTLRKNKNIEYISVDIESPAATVKADISELPLNNNDFDLIICSHVLQHVDDDKKAISELYRVLKQGGEMLLYSWIRMDIEKTIEGKDLKSNKEREKILGHPELLRCYGRDFIPLLEAAGFKVRMEKFDEKFSEFQMKEYGQFPANDSTIICTKL